MKTIFDPATNDELIQRINMLRENSRAACNSIVRPAGIEWIEKFTA